MLFYIKNKIYILILFFWSYEIYAQNFQPKVETPHGTYYGTVRTSEENNKTYYAFTGIPYAKPPIGSLRFKNPVPLDSHPPVFNATKIPPECLQWDNLLGRGMVGDEDCLYLNIYSSYLSPPPKYPDTKPILVFLHAGTWMSGSAASDIYTPDYLIHHGIMVITLNHRLGPMGFLSTGNKDAPGNYGLMDQIMALEWIRENSRYFGGTNISVTVMGSGAGGISSHFLTLTPKARGVNLEADDFVLLHRAISHSGTAYSPHAFIRNYNFYTMKLAQKFGCDSTNSRTIIDCLRWTPDDKIINAIPTLYEWDEEPIPFGPVLDKEWMGDEAYFPDEPFHLIKHNKVLKIPWIVGTNKNDGAFRVQDILSDPVLVNQLNKNWEKFGPILLHLTKDSCKDPVDMSKKIRDFYMGKDKFGTHSEKKFIEMMTDRFFLYPTEKASKEHCSLYLGEKNFCYRYEHHFSAPTTFLDVLHKINPNVAAKASYGKTLSNPRFQNVRDIHGYGMSFLDELMYIFPGTKLGFKNNKDLEYVSNVMHVLWINFIKMGDPTPVIGDNEDAANYAIWGTWWEPYVKGYLYYLKIDSQMETQDTPLKETEMTFWNNLPLFENTDHHVIRDEL